MLTAGLEATNVITAPDYGNLTLRPPEVTFNDRMTLHLEEFPVELRHVGGPAHTTNDVLVWLPEQRGAVRRRPGLQRWSAVRAGGVDPRLPLGHRADAGARPRHVLAPGHGPVCHGEDVATLLASMDAYLGFVQDVATESYAAGLTPLEAAQKHRDNPYSDWAETERFVGNLHRAYSELAGNPADTRLTVPSVWPDMVTFHGGPIPCHA